MGWKNIKESCELLGVGKTTLYAKIRSGELTSRKIKGKTEVLLEESEKKDPKKEDLNKMNDQTEQSERLGEQVERLKKELETLYQKPFEALKSQHREQVEQLGEQIERLSEQLRTKDVQLEKAQNTIDSFSTTMSAIAAKGIRVEKLAGGGWDIQDQDLKGIQLSPNHEPRNIILASFLGFGLVFAIVVWLLMGKTYQLDVQPTPNQDWLNRGV